MKAVVRCAFVAVAVLFVGGCSGDGSVSWPVGASTAAPSGAPADASTAAERPKGGAPSVPEPLDIDVDDPCGTLTTEQLAAVGVSDPGDEGFDDGDGECRWHLDTSQLHIVTLSPATSRGGGLGEIYGQKDSQQYFEPVDIEGYPAVYASVLDQRERGGCTLWVGTSDDLAVEITTSFLEVDPCPVAEQFATDMIENAG
jgi:uncharacterized protein DUF3558